MSNTTKKIGDMIERQREQRERIADLESQLAARDATIAEQVEALEGYRGMVFTNWTDPTGRTINAACLTDRHVHAYLPAHEIAELRKRGVEVGA